MGSWPKQRQPESSRIWYVNVKEEGSIFPSKHLCEDIVCGCPWSFFLSFDKTLTETETNTQRKREPPHVKRETAMRSSFEFLSLACHENMLSMSGDVTVMESIHPLFLSKIVWVFWHLSLKEGWRIQMNKRAQSQSYKGLLNWHWGMEFYLLTILASSIKRHSTLWG